MRVAIVGCGMISDVYIRNLKSLFSIIDLVALCDMNTALAHEKAQRYAIEKCMSLEEILKAPGIELVINLTGPSAHFEILKQCLTAGKNCYTEKPLCLTLEEAQELVSLADEKGLCLGAAPDTFLGAGLQTARKVLDAGMIGRVTSAVASVNRDHLLNSEIYPFIRRKGGGFSYDYGIYYVTALVALLGQVKQVCGFVNHSARHEAQLLYMGTGGTSWTLEDENIAVGALRFDSGALGVLHFNGESIAEEQQTLTIYGTEGILSLGDPNRFDGRVRLIRNGNAPCDLPFTHGYSSCPGSANGQVQDGYGYRGIGVCEMAWSMRKGRRPRASKELAAHALEILQGMALSEKSGMAYKLATRVERPRPLPSNYMSANADGSVRLDAELSLAL